MPHHSQYYRHYANVAIPITTSNRAGRIKLHAMTVLLQRTRTLYLGKKPKISTLPSRSSDCLVLFKLLLIRDVDVEQHTTA